MYERSGPHDGENDGSDDGQSHCGFNSGNTEIWWACSGSDAAQRGLIIAVKRQIKEQADTVSVQPQIYIKVSLF